MSVRTRLTVAVGLIIAVLAAGAALLAPTVVEQALIDDLLDADAEDQAQFLADETIASIFETIVAIDGELPDGAIDGTIIEGGVIESGVVVGGPVEVLAADEVLQQLGVDELHALIQQGGSDDLIVALGGNTFVNVDANGEQTLVSSDAGAFDQPILTFYELFQRGPTSNVFDIPPDLVGDDGFIDDAALAEFAEATNVRTVTGIRAVDGVDFYVSSDADSLDRTVSRVRTVLWAAMPIAVLIAGLASWVLAGRALRPVRAITEQTARITGGTLDERVPVPQSGDEVAALATTMNGMLDRLEGDDSARRRFVSDASHELRSPVAVLRSEAEVALRAPERTDVEQLASGVLDESTRMATIIDDLLALARHDEGVRAPTTEIDLDDIVLAEAQRARRVPIDASAVSAGRVRGRPDEFARVVSHLLDNAARHAESRIAVTLTSFDHAVTLLVDDDGPGVPEDQRSAIFERFTRLDEARTRDRGGAGLGLSVVVGVVERSGGSVRVTDSPLGGARFTVEMPAH